jgi:outer membrane protein, multidrug efflux system
MKRWFFYTLAVVMLEFLPGCKVHHTLKMGKPAVDVPTAYSHADESGIDYPCEWWQAFDTLELNLAVDEALFHNLDLKQSWWRVAQACWQARIVGSQKYPEITVNPSVIHFRTSNPGSGGGQFQTGEVGLGGGDVSSTGSGKDHFTTYLLSSSLSYEVDLWRRIDSETRAACYELQATREDLESAAWMLAGTVVELCFVIQEQEALLEVIDQQIEASRTQLELIELRFSVGISSALEVYQQRLQLAQTEQLRTPVETLLQTSQNQMDVLLGTPPGGRGYTSESGLVPLPPFPEIRSPVELLCRRPDLRAIYRRLQAADYQVAAAVADRFPRLNLTINYEFRSNDIKKLFEDQISTIIGSLLIPVFDGGRRSAEVHRRQAIVCELVNAYGQGFLDALLEVENSLIEEKQQIKLLNQHERELEIAIVNLEQSYWHYTNGLSDYLTVITALQIKQNLERRIVSEKKRLLAIRARLYRSLGGRSLTSCKTCSNLSNLRGASYV